jgi:hypothetical protein
MGIVLAAFLLTFRASQEPLTSLIHLHAVTNGDWMERRQSTPPVSPERVLPAHAAIG